MEADKIKDAGVLPVRVDLLNTLMDLAGELVLGRNQMLQGIGRQDMKSIESAGHRIDMITSELQEAVMKTRMQSVAGLFDSLKETAVRAADALDRKIGLTTLGDDVELDTAILGSIQTPLEELTEYCMGCLPGGEAAGKSQVPQLEFRAENDAGQIVISLSHDGSRDLPLPGAARTGIEGLGGSIETEARTGGGSHIRVKLPLTLAIIPSQIASVGMEKYAIPQANLEELIRIPADQVKERIEKVGDAEVVRLRGELLPVLDFARMLEIPKYYTDPATGETRSDRRVNVADRRSVDTSQTDGGLDSDDTPQPEPTERNPRDRRRHPSSALNIAVVFSGNYRYGLVIDTLHDAEEIVVKPLGRHMKQDRAWAGATIMGDGNVALILDILNLAQMGGLAPCRDEGRAEERAAADADFFSVVAFKNLDHEYFAAPFESVARIERVTVRDIEPVGHRRVIQYRGGTLPLYQLSDMVNVAPLPEREIHEVVVFSIGNREFGLMVTPPVDTVETDGLLDETTLKQTGVKGSVVIDGHTTLMIDVDEMTAHFLSKF